MRVLGEEVCEIDNYVSTLNFNYGSRSSNNRYWVPQKHSVYLYMSV
jgi:hypothetical protein